LVAAFKRIFGATIFFGTESHPKTCACHPTLQVQFPQRGPNLVQP
jgi:hypothetical protein